MIRTLVEAAQSRSHRYQDKRPIAVKVSKPNSWEWLVSVIRYDENDNEVVVCKAFDATCTRALLACGFALVVAQHRTSRLHEAVRSTRSLAAAVSKALRS